MSDIYAARDLIFALLGLWTRFGRGGLPMSVALVHPHGSHICDPYKSESNSLPG